MSYRPILLLILLIAAFLRLFGLADLSPPGLAHDEVAHWLINRDILAGQHAIYFTEAYGHEAAFHYLQTLFMILLGDNSLALRLPAAFCGLLLVAVSFSLIRRLFGWQVALIAAAYLAIILWPVFFSRQALRAISLPLVTGLAAYFWWQGWQAKATSGQAAFILAGFFAGLSLHTYMAARAVPIFFLLFTLYLALFHWPAFKKRWPGIALFFILYTLVAAPLVYYLATNPGIEARVAEVDAPLRALREGDFGPVIANSLKILAMFGWSGDPLWRQNVAFQPVFEPVTALFFYAGLALSLWRWRDARYGFILLWLSTSAIPSIVTIDAPSSIRISNSLPFLTFFPAIVIHSLFNLSPTFQQLSTNLGEKATKSLLIFLLLFNIGWTSHAIFIVWPSNDEVQFVWQEALTRAAKVVDKLPADQTAAIAGWTPETMDPPTMTLNTGRAGELRYFDPAHTLIVPGAAQAHIIRPTILPLNPYLERKLAGWGASIQRDKAITHYRLASPPAVAPERPLRVSFGNELLLLGYTTLTPCRPAGDCRMISYWRVTRLPDGPRRFFLHLIGVEGEMAQDEAGRFIQDDGLGAPAEHWRPGDLILYQHNLAIPAGGPYHLHLGVYDPTSGRRLPAGDGADFWRLFETGP